MIHRISAPLLVAISAAALFAAACGGDDDRPTARIFEAPPWTGDEHLTYQLSARGEQDAGRCVLETISGNGTVTLNRLCGKDEFRDDSTATTNPQTLAPARAERTVSDAKKGKKATYTNTYSDGSVQFEATVEGKVSRTTRDLPKPTKQSPEPAWYDDDTVLWLVRGTPLRSGFRGAYVHVINAGQPRLLVTDISVDGTETVRTAAGEFRAWKVRITRENTTLRYWVDEQKPHRVVRAAVEDVNYELVDVK